jgi:hypothetical protein
MLLIKNLVRFRGLPEYVSADFTYNTFQIAGSPIGFDFDIVGAVIYEKDYKAGYKFLEKLVAEFILPSSYVSLDGDAAVVEYTFLNKKNYLAVK